MGAVSRQGRPEGADGLGGETRSDHGQGRGGPAWGPTAPGGSPQCVGPDGDQVLRGATRRRRRACRPCCWWLSPSRVERYFEDQEQEVGLDQWGERHWLGLKRT